MRKDWDQYFMEIAKTVSSRSTCPRKAVGAILVKDNSIISTGYNGSIRGNDHCTDTGCLMVHDHCVRTIHAEINAVAQAAKNGISTNGTTAYVNVFPCWHCYKTLANAGVSRIVYGESYRPWNLPEQNLETDQVILTPLYKLKPKQFSVIIAVYGARHSLELTLRTLLAVSENYVDHIYLIDSSYQIDGSYFKETCEFMNDFVKEYPQVSVNQSIKHAHGLKLDSGILAVKTPYTLLLDSDVEFYSGEIFQKVQEQFETNEKLFMIGHGDPPISLGRRYIEEENMYLGGLFVRTETAQHYVENDISFFRKDAVERRDDQPGRIRVFYDTSSYMHHYSKKQGYLSLKLEMNGKYFKHLEHGSWTEHQSSELFLKLENKLQEKPWENLSQHPCI